MITNLCFLRSFFKTPFTWYSMVLFENQMFRLHDTAWYYLKTKCSVFMIQHGTIWKQNVPFSWYSMVLFENKVFRLHDTAWYYLKTKCSVYMIQHDTIWKQNVPFSLFHASENHVFILCRFHVIFCRFHVNARRKRHDFVPFSNSTSFV